MATRGKAKRDLLLKRIELQEGLEAADEQVSNRRRFPLLTLRVPIGVGSLPPDLQPTNEQIATFATEVWHRAVEHGIELPVLDGSWHFFAGAAKALARIYEKTLSAEWDSSRPSTDLLQHRFCKAAVIAVECPHYGKYDNDHGYIERGNARAVMLAAAFDAGAPSKGYYPDCDFGLKIAGQDADVCRHFLQHIGRCPG